MSSGAVSRQKVAVLSCPRCPAALPFPEIAQHLWVDHGRILYGQAVRDPWRLIEEWVREYRREGHPEILARSRELGRRLDPDHGLRRVHRLFLAGGVADGEARRSLLTEAAENLAALCPHCFRLVPLREATPLPPLNVSHGRLSGRGYYVEVGDRWMQTRLEVGRPEGAVFRGREPRQRLTERGALVLWAGTATLLALALAVALPRWHLSPLLPVLGALLLACAGGRLARIRWRIRSPALDRAVDYAWTILVPRLVGSPPSAADLTFVGGLAMLSAAGHGRPRRRAARLQQILGAAEKAVAAGAASAAALAALHRLRIEDATAEGADPVPETAAQVARCFDGALPLVFAQQLLTALREEPWNPVTRARLRVTLCDSAFGAGFEVRDLLEAGGVSPALGKVLKTDDPEGLAALRMVWSLRAGKAWESCGRAEHVFHLASRPGAESAILGPYPDLLLAPAEVEDLFLTAGGLVFKGHLMTHMPEDLEIRPDWGFRGGGYYLVLAGKRFWFPGRADQLGRRLERWCRYYFRELMPQVRAVYCWQSAPHIRRLFDSAPSLCPGCGRAVVVRVGELATPADEARARSAVG